MPPLAVGQGPVGQVVPVNGLRGWFSGLTPRDRGIYLGLLALLLVIFSIYTVAGLNLLREKGLIGDGLSPADPTAVATDIVLPSQTPSSTPSATSTSAPTATSTSAPTATSTSAPSETPTETIFIPPPTLTNTASPLTTASPTEVPSSETAPVESPTAEPTTVPTAEPTTVPTAEPTTVPTAEPTTVPTAEPTAETTAEPTKPAIFEPSVDIELSRLDGTTFPAMFVRLLQNNSVQSSMGVKPRQCVKSSSWSL